MSKPIWYEIAESKLGLDENKDKTILSRFLRSDGHTIGDPTKLPWCGDFVETCVALALPDERIPENPYLARNWLRFGREIDTPVIGAIAVFWRKSEVGLYGHVGFYAGEDKDFIYVLGGNQGNAISITKLRKERLLGYTWPINYPISQGTIKTDGPIAISEDEE